MRHAPYGHHEDESSETESDDLESAEEDKSEEELLIANPVLFDRLQPWGRREILVAGVGIMAWYATSISAIMANKTILRSRRYASPFFISAVYMAMKWLLSRLLMLIMRRPPLVFRRHAHRPTCRAASKRSVRTLTLLSVRSRSGSWRPYLLTVATAGVLTSLDVGLALCSYLYVSVTFIVVVKASTPCWQLLFGVALARMRCPPVPAHAMLAPTDPLLDRAAAARCPS